MSTNKVCKWVRYAPLTSTAVAPCCVCLKRFNKLGSWVAICSAKTEELHTSPSQMTDGHQTRSFLGTVLNSSGQIVVPVETNSTRGIVNPEYCDEWLKESGTRPPPPQNRCLILFFGTMQKLRGLCGQFLLRRIFHLAIYRLRWKRPFLSKSNPRAIQ